MLPNANDLENFLQVMQTLNMSRAAERVGITQPALSQSIKRLENNLGQNLFLRGKGGVKPTKAGDKLATRAKLLLEEWNKLTDEMGKDETEIRGKFNLGVHTAVAQYTLDKFMPKLLSDHKKLEFRLFHDLSRKITEDIVSFKLDFGIVVNPYPHPDLVIRELMKDEVSFWRAKKETLNNRPYNEECTLLIEPDLTQTQDLLKKISKKKVFYKRTLTSASLEVIAHLTACGAGIGLLPARVAAGEGKGIELVDKKWPKFDDRICLVFRADVQKSLAAKQIITFIQQQLKN